MANKMIIDASHPEETRVVVLRGNRVEEFDFESASKRPLRGNIYLAKVTRVEPSLQAAFVDYGGNRHGFLAFSEIHPDYYQIPIADRQALLEEEALSQRDEDDEPNNERRSRRHRRPREYAAEASVTEGEAASEVAPPDERETESSPHVPPPEDGTDAAEPSDFAPESDSDGEARAEANALPPQFEETAAPGGVTPTEPYAPDLHEQGAAAAADALDAHVRDDRDARAGDERQDAESLERSSDHTDYGHEVTTIEGGSEERVSPAPRQPVEYEGEPVEQIGGDALEEVPRRPHRSRRQYKIQEVIKRRQVLLVQVVKEERGNKGAALTTYLSLAGRYSVLMPNTARGGGISRKITNAQDRSRLKSIAEELDVPEGMGVILRTAGATRTKAEVKRDFEYLLRMWETVRETTLASSAPTLVYEEGSLIKRAIRDLYNKDVEEIIVAGEAGFREARQFMRLLMPSHVNAVQLYRDTQPVFAKAGVESQLDAMFSNQVTLKSGGYIVINQTEALVAIDVNSGRSTREHNIEDTALRTNLEAADEIARQLRLRDLAGLIVVDFIDMEESRNNRAVERRIKDALKNDRARIQVGRISHFGLLEMSRQRIRTGVLEGSTVVCAHCQGAGVVRSTSSIALHVLRVLEDALIKSATHDVVVRTRTPVALYILNQKRANLRDLERRFGVVVTIDADDTLTGANYHAIERGELATGVKGEIEPPPLAQDDFVTVVDEPMAVEDETEEAGEVENEPEGSTDDGESESASEGPGLPDEGESGRRRRRRRRRRGAERPFGESVSPDAPQPTDDGLAVVAEIGGDLTTQVQDGNLYDRSGPRAEGDRGRRSRRSRGGRNRYRPRSEAEGFDSASPSTERAAVEAAEADDRGPMPEDAAPERPSPSSELESALQAEASSESALASGAVDEMQSARSDEPAPTDTASAEQPAVEPGDASPHGEESHGDESAAPSGEESPRPRRSGWWQRARASIVGN